MPSGSIFSDIGSFEDRLALPRGFYERLLAEDDWSFVIKLNALFEAACTHALVARLHAPELAEPLANLDFANTKSGKVVLLYSLAAITPEQSSLLHRLAQLRNTLVHNIANVSFTFAGHVTQLDKNQRTAFTKTFGHGIRESTTVEGKTVTRDEFTLQNPKLAIWLTAAEVLACIYLEFELAELRLRQSELDGYFKLAQGLLKPILNTPEQQQ